MSASRQAADTDTVHLLIVEDDRQIATLLKRGFDSEPPGSGVNFETRVAGDVAAAKAIAGKFDVDIMLLDMNLPKCSGSPAWHLAGADIVAETKRNPLIGKIVYSAEPLDEVASPMMDLGADYYIQKPSELPFIIASVKALWRRIKTVKYPLPAAGAASGPHVFGDCEYTVGDMFLARKGGDSIRLTPTERSLLDALCVSAAQALSRRDFYERIMGMKYYGGDRSFETTICSLRKKMGHEHITCDPDGSVCRLTP